MSVAADLASTPLRVIHVNTPNGSRWWTGLGWTSKLAKALILADSEQAARISNKIEVPASVLAGGVTDEVE